MKAENTRIEKEGGWKVDGSVFWMKQTVRFKVDINSLTLMHPSERIGNACGAMALMHAMANTDVTFTPASPLARFFASDPCQPPTTPAAGEARAALFSSTPEFADIHAEVCNAGQSVPASATEHPEGAYACFVKKCGRLIELDGGNGRGGAVDRGPCDELVESVALLMKDVFMKGMENDKFNLMYFGESL